MEIRSLTAAPEIGSFQLHQTIMTSYRAMPELDNTALMTIAARRDPPAVETRLSSNGGPDSITLMIDDELWSRAGDQWTRTTPAEVPTSWTLRAYRELGEMSLVAPLQAETVIAASSDRGTELVADTSTVRFSADTELMLRLLTADFESRQAPPSGPAPPASYIKRYEADFWVASETGFIIRERTVIEYTEERLHDRAVGTGPATLTTTRTFSAFNARVDVVAPS